MKFSRPIALVAAFLFMLGGYGCKSQSAEEVVEACEAVCDRLDECEADLSLLDPANGEVDCFATCDDLDELESEISQSCKDAITTVFECVEGLTCTDVDDIDFTRHGRLLHPFLPGLENNPILTVAPPVILNDPDCMLRRNAGAYDYCPVNSDCIRFTLFEAGYARCTVSGFDMITMQVEDCAVEYTAMAEECRREPRF